MTQRTYATSTGYTDYGTVLYALDARPHESLYEAARRVLDSGEGRTDVAATVLPAAELQWQCIAAAAVIARRPQIVSVKHDGAALAVLLVERFEDLRSAAVAAAEQREHEHKQ